MIPYKQQLLRASKKKLIRAAIRRHKEVTRCSNQQAKQWVEGELPIIQGKAEPTNERIESIDHSLVNLLMNECLNNGFEANEAKSFVYKRFPKHWKWFFTTLNRLATENGGSYKIGDVEFTP